MARNLVRVTLDQGPTWTSAHEERRMMSVGRASGATLVGRHD